MTPFETRDQLKIADFDAIRLRLASPETIREWSHGEVTKPETINYRTQKPEKSGLFAEEIFGPSKDWECYCGKYKKIRYKGIVCDKCGVEVTSSLVRRERMGHIELAAPVSHIWYLRGVPSKIGLMLDISVMNLEKVIYFASFIITKVDAKLKDETLEQIKSEYKGKKKQIENEYEQAVKRLQEQGGDPSTPQGAGGAGKTAARLEEAAKARDRKLDELEEDYKAAESDLRELAPMKIIPEATYHDWSLKYGHLFEAGIGAEAIRDLLRKIDIDKTIEVLKAEIAETTGAKVERMVRRAKLLHSLKVNKIRPEWMIMVNMPVIPPDLRPMVPLDGGRFATSDLNDLYRRVINRNNRLKRLVELNAPEVITRNEKRMLQEAVDAFIDNSARQTKTVIASSGRKRQLKSLADVLKGKQGRFRQNLLGKRIDYSGRSVIVVGPTLLMHQCGLPKRMALELFKPFVISKLINRGFVHNIRSANRFIEANNPEVWDLLEETTKDSLVLLNRAPTLHRLGIQAFQPVLIEGKAVKIHPLVCTAFNADFDGDQMAVHVPLTEEAKAEARDLMLSTKNLLKPAHGNPICTPNRDIVWGCYYMTAARPKAEHLMAFGSEKEAILAYEMGKIKLQDIAKIRRKTGRTTEIVETTVGRVILNAIFPESVGFVNDHLDGKKIGDIIRRCIVTDGLERTAVLLDDLKEIGFRYITRSGFSWGMDYLPNLQGKSELIALGDKRVEEIEDQYNEGLLTSSERHSKIVEVWMDCKDKIVKLSKEQMNKSGPVFSMVESGARGSWSQLTQMVGMKGPVSNPTGDIIELPVKKSFKEGIDVLEYFISTHGSRKGLADTALRTANAGYLTRRLVDVAQDTIVRLEDCGDNEGFLITAKEAEEMGQQFVARLVTRAAAKDIVNPKNGKVIIPAGEYITDDLSKEAVKAGVVEAHIRSVLACRLPKGVCQKCYGFDMATNGAVKFGTAVGIIAAQSIGEPGTQLTMRTFHSGGVAGLDITQGLPRVEELFEARSPKRRAITTDVAGKVSIEEVERKVIEAPTGKKILETFPGQKIVRIAYSESETETLKVAKGDKVEIKGKANVAPGQTVITKKNGTQVVSEHGGIAEVGEKAVKIARDVEALKEFVIPPGYVLYVKNGDAVTAGDALTEGDLDLHELFTFKGRDAVQRYLLHEIQTIYTSQGQRLNDKHIETIIRQMFGRITIVDSGDTDLLPGEVVERAEFDDANEQAKKAKGKLAEGSEMFMGITKISLSTRSWLSAASFQETAKVLINASLTGKTDPLEGLKENVIIGRLIPAGTGYNVPRE
jgi:DNA-directed RNA polymerase subunit beta'